MNASLFGSFQLFIRTLSDPMAGLSLIIKPYGADSPCRVSMLTSLAARSVFT